MPPRMLKKAVQQGRNERRGRRTPRYVEPPERGENDAGRLFQHPASRQVPPPVDISFNIRYILRLLARIAPVKLDY